jgi:ABC-type transport system substrate-binding protein
MKFVVLASALLVAQNLLVGAETSVNAGALKAAISCNQELDDLEFVFLEDEAVVRSIEDDVRSDLAAIGFNVEGRPLSKADLNTARQSGDFHISISETWGLPYDPHSFAQGWIDGNGGEGIFPAMVNFDEPSSREELLDMVKDVLQQDDPRTAQSKWADIHKYYHEQAVLLPLFGKRIPTLMNRRLSGYEAGFQQFDYPVHRLRVVSGSKTVTIAPGARNGLFHTVGTMNPHVYGPNEFFSNNWVYEGLVAFGDNGQVVPALATSWAVSPNDIGGDTYTFQLRQGVKFHDGADWNCTVAKLNFDHILVDTLASWGHGWYGVGTNTNDWYCNGDFEFVMRTNLKHESYLNELALIRPTRMLSPNGFIGGLDSDPYETNSCHTDWGTIDGSDPSKTVKCSGIESIAGTGPFSYVSKQEADGTTNRVTFAGNLGYWGGAPEIDQLEVVRYTANSDVKEALLSGELDVVWGAGVLSDKDILEIKNDPVVSEQIQVGMGDAIQNAMLILNTGAPPLDDINVRKTVIHAINKGAIIEKELPLSQMVDNIFPKGAPYCDVELNPRWSYDFEKAVLLSCDGTAGNFAVADNKLAVGLGVGLGVPLGIIFIAALVLMNKNKALQDKLDVQMKEGAQSA